MNTNQFYSFICFISQIADDASVIQLFPQVQIHMCPRCSSIWKVLVSAVRFLLPSV